MTAEPLQVALAAAIVGTLIGLTGMGGGALLTPALILLGIPPTAAVANDLVATALTKVAGAWAHWRAGTADLAVAARLSWGSVPAALLTGAWVGAREGTNAQHEWLRSAIGVTLLVTVVVTVASKCWRARANQHALLAHSAIPEAGAGDRPSGGRSALLVLTGAIVGALVAVTSVGSGTLAMAAMLIILPKWSPRRMVGTDLAQAVPMLSAAALGHALTRGLDWALIVPLVLGGAPAVVCGAALAQRVPTTWLQPLVLVLISASGLALVLG